MYVLSSCCTCSSCGWSVILSELQAVAAVLLTLGVTTGSTLRPGCKVEDVGQAGEVDSSGEIDTHAMTSKCCTAAIVGAASFIGCLSHSIPGGMCLACREDGHGELAATYLQRIPPAPPLALVVLQDVRRCGGGVGAVALLGVPQPSVEEVLGPTRLHADTLGQGNVLRRALVLRHPCVVLKDTIFTLAVLDASPGVQLRS